MGTWYQFYNWVFPYENGNFVKTQLKGVSSYSSVTHQTELHMNASMLSYILLSCVLLSVQAQKCQVNEIIRYTNHLLVSGCLAP